MTTELEQRWPDPDRRDSALLRLLYAVHRKVPVFDRPLRSARRRLQPCGPVDLAAADGILCAIYRGDDHELRPDELLALSALSHGLTVGETSTVLGVPIKTLKPRIRHARQLLRAKNSTHAVAVAIRRGLIP